jgi:hypothetical protein
MIVKAEGVVLNSNVILEKVSYCTSFGYAHTILYQFSRLIRFVWLNIKYLCLAKPSLLFEVASNTRISPS